MMSLTRQKVVVMKRSSSKASFDEFRPYPLETLGP